MKQFWAAFLSLILSSTLISAHSSSDSRDDKGSFELTLTDAFFKNSYIVGDISAHGKQVLLGYAQASPVDSSLPVMELFDNQDGTLVSQATLPLDSFITSGGEINNVVASRNFEYFADFDDDGGTTGRIRLFTQNGNTFGLINTSTFTDVDISKAESLCFTDDNKYIVYSYSTTASTPTNVVTKLNLLRISDFALVSSITVTGVSNGPSAFRLASDKNYVLFGITNSQHGFFAAPSELQVYAIKNHQLKLVDQAALPQFPVSYFAFDPSKCGIKETRIVLATQLALLPGQVSVFDNAHTINAQSLLPDDNNNIREYSFDGKSLRLIAKQSTDTANLVSNFYRDGKTFASAKGTSGGTVQIPTQLFYVSFFTTSGSKKHSFFEPVGETIIAPGQCHLVTFSRDGDWLLVGGLNNINGFKNVNLYKVKSSLKKFKCHDS